jgi:2-C-methyl-D-erythritol 4-phosphate cytidylyltransferase
MNRFALIVPAAGSGSRTGGDIPKQYVEIDGRPVLAWTLDAFLAIDECVEIVVPIDERWREIATACVADARVRFVAGGAERQHSIAAALGALESDAELVLVHDAARPCVGRALIERVVEAAALHGAALPVLPIAETVKQVGADGRVIATIARDTLRLAQTPQGFRRALLERAYAAARSASFIGTDDASLVEALGEPVVTVEGDATNIKITVADDFARAASHLARP